jgi:uncharacterized protein YndB with AHSA1/START domain
MAQTATKPHLEPAADGAPGTVQVTVEVNANAEQVWRALTEAEITTRWFGNLSSSLAPGGSHRLDFGDGDFFTISEVRFDAPRRLQYRWRFLGTGPENLITWNLAPGPNTTVVTVNDYEENRSQAGVRDLTEGWTDFLGRLERFYATGQDTRYDWRREFDGAIEFPVPVERAMECLVFRPEAHRWLPWKPAAISEGLQVSIGDGMDPDRFTISGLARLDESSISFELGCEAWSGTTKCVLQIRPHGSGSILVVAHSDWEAVSTNDTDQMLQRKRFGALWIAALEAAKETIDHARS